MKFRPILMGSVSNSNSSNGKLETYSSSPGLYVTSFKKTEIKEIAVISLLACLMTSTNQALSDADLETAFGMVPWLTVIGVMD